MNDADSEGLRAGIRKLRERLGGLVVMPAHHYQRPEIVAFGDFVGDSYKLAVEGAKSDAAYILFCGVRFMAESAAILARPGQTVLIPDPVAGCPMADMIDAAAAEAVLAKLDAMRGVSLAPVTYMNSYADMKALTGRRGGSICTSSNARLVMEHYLKLGRPMFFGPDYNLGINTARAMKLDPDKIFTVNRDGTVTGREGADPAKGVLFLWDGSCHVHKRFTVADIDAARKKNPAVKVIVHPECDEAVVAAADLSGSTEAIFKAIRDSSPGSAWVVGTEASFVHRLAAEYPSLSVLPLRESYCFNMARIELSNVLASLQSIAAHEEDPGASLLFPVTVDRSVQVDAARALNAMIAIVENSRPEGSARPEGLPR